MQIMVPNIPKQMWQWEWTWKCHY